MYLFEPPPDPEGNLVHALLAVLEWGPRELVADFLGWAGVALPAGVAPSEVRIHGAWRVGGVRADGALHVPGRYLLLVDGRDDTEGREHRLVLTRTALERLPYPSGLILLGSTDDGAAAGEASAAGPGGQASERPEAPGIPGALPATRPPDAPSAAPPVPEPRPGHHPGPEGGASAGGPGEWQAGQDVAAAGGAEGGAGQAPPLRRRSWASLFAWLRRGQGRHPPGGSTYLLVDELCRLIEREGLVAFGGFRVDEFARAAEALPAAAPVLRAYFRLVDAVCDELEGRGHEVEELEPPEDEEYALWEQGVLVTRLLVDGGGGEGEAADDVEIDVTLDLEARALEVGLYLLPDRHPGFWRWVEQAALPDYEVRPLDPTERAEAEEAGIVWSQPLDADLGLLASRLVDEVAGRTEALMRLCQDFLGT